MNQCRGGCLSIATGDADNPAASPELISQFYFADDLDTACPDFFYQLIFLGDTRAFHDLISIQNFVFCMLTFFKINSGCLQFVAIRFFQRAFICEKHFISLLLREQRSTHTAFSTSQYYHSFTHRPDVLSAPLVAQSRKEKDTSLCIVN